jgi:serine/threonine protein kinase/Tol biopolymer transport system component
MQLSTGDKLGPYEITGLIGKGGMGEVYRGADTRLGRPVAIKVSSREFNDRFEREAKAISALNHPNICTLYDIGPNYLVMELVEGEMLSKIIERGPLPLDRALQYAVQIVDALAAAHANGVIHRDLKPGNIIITRNGVKVLDFGLAKLNSERLPSGDDIATVTEPITRAGAVLGTLHYMAPEQVEAKETDERSDIFSFGVVLYEMITGHRPFTGDTQAAVLASLMKDPPPPISPRQPATPRALERVVRKCLEKKPDDRWHSARDLKPTLELIDLDAPPPSSASSSVPIPVQTPPPAKQPKRWLWPAIAAAAVLIAAAATAALYLKPPAPTRATRFQVTLPEGVEFSQYVSVSPDGHKLVFNATGAKSGLWVRDLDTLEWRHLQGTENSVSPFWSPDSRFLGFSVGNELKKIEVAGGPPFTLATLQMAGGSSAWNPDGVILVGNRGNGPLQRVPASGGVAVEVTAVDRSRGERSHTFPSFLPDGKHFVYFIRGQDRAAGMYAGSLDAKPSEQPKDRILANTFNAPVVGGKMFFLRAGTLMAQPFDTGKLQLAGEPVPIAEHVGAELSAGYFAVSPAGVLAYRTGTSAGSGMVHTWFDRQGKVTGVIGEPGPDSGVVLSPDGTRVAGRDPGPQANGDIWVKDLARGVRTRLTFRQSLGSFPVWSPDGSRIAFSAGTVTALDTIYEKASSGAGEEKELFKKENEIKVPSSWSRDGRFLLYMTPNDPKTRNDLWVLPLGGERKPVQLLATEFSEGNASFSPDMRWIAYQSNESRRDEIYVRPFTASGPALGQGKWQLSKDGGTQPRWTAAGKELIFMTTNGSVMAVDVSASGAALQVGTPKLLFNAPPNDGVDVTADGKRFLILTSPGQQQNTAAPLTVVLNWEADLKR